MTAEPTITERVMRRDEDGNPEVVWFDWSLMISAGLRVSGLARTEQGARDSAAAAWADAARHGLTEAQR